MRTLIIDATVIDGTGAPPRPRCAVVVEDHLIEDVVERRAPYYDRADIVIDARGGFLLPGLVDHHAHGLTRGPLMIVGQPPLSDARVGANLDRLLRQGVTTALNVDGFPTVEDAHASTRHHPLTVKAATLHTPRHLAWAGDGLLAFGGVRPQHRWTVEQMLERGALAVGEAGPGLDAHWTDYALIPTIVDRLGGTVPNVEEARALRLAMETGDSDALDASLKTVGLGMSARSQFRDDYHLVEQWSADAEASLSEAIAAAGQHQVPLIFHHTPTTHPIQLEAAQMLGGRHIAAHSNFQCESLDDALTRAKAVRRRGGLVDIMSGDCFSGREFHPTSEITFGMLAEGVVDLISTDYAGGFWDSMLLLIDEAVHAGAVELGEGVRLVTSAPAEAVPGLAPDRGTVAPGFVADLVITAPARLPHVCHVLVSGRRVPLPDNDWS